MIVPLLESRCVTICINPVLLYYFLVNSASFTIHSIKFNSLTAAGWVWMQWMLPELNLNELLAEFITFLFRSFFLGCPFPLIKLHAVIRSSFQTRPLCFILIHHYSFWISIRSFLHISALNFWFMKLQLH